MQNRPVLSLVSGIVLLLGSGGLAACIDYQAQVNQAVRAHDLDSLEPLFATVKTHCPRNYLEWLRRSMAQIAAAQADSLTQQGRLDEASEWLKRAPTVVWATQVVRGDIAARRKHWQAAAQYYNHALDLIADEEATPQAPPQTVIQKVFQLASQAQVLVGNIDDTVSRSGEASGMMLGNIRGFKPSIRLIPIHFPYDASVLSEKGKKAARQLATYIKQYVRPVWPN